MSKPLWLWINKHHAYNLYNLDLGLVFILSLPETEKEAIYTTTACAVSLTIRSLHNEHATEYYENGQAITLWAQLRAQITIETARPGLLGWVAGRLEEAQQALAKRHRIELLCPECGHSQHDGYMCMESISIDELCTCDQGSNPPSEHETIDPKTP